MELSGIPGGYSYCSFLFFLLHFFQFSHHQRYQVSSIRPEACCAQGITTCLLRRPKQRSQVTCRWCGKRHTLYICSQRAFWARSVYGREWVCVNLRVPYYLCGLATCTNAVELPQQQRWPSWVRPESNSWRYGEWMLYKSGTQPPVPVGYSISRLLILSESCVLMYSCWFSLYD